MKELVILRPLRSGALPEGKGAYLDVETHQGPCPLRFTLEDAERLVAALHAARKDLHAARTRAGQPPLPDSHRPQRWETGIDPVEQQAVLRTHFSDGTTEETQIPRTELPRIIGSLEQALKRFEAGGEMRQ